MPKQVDGQIDIFAVLEGKDGPPPCPHIPNSKQGHGYALEYDKTSEYYNEWVHADPNCRRSTFPGRKHDDPQTW